jgi:hypothetical protein
LKTSLFTPYGAFPYKGGRPPAQILHESIVALFSDGSDFALNRDIGSFVDCFAFTFARLLAKLQLRTERLDRERLAAGAYELLPALEEEFGLRPSPNDSPRTRRAALLAAMRAALGSRRTVLEQSLSDLLGDDYIGIHVHGTSDVELWPAALGDDPMLLALPDAPRKVVRLPDAISTDLGTPQWIEYEPIDPIEGDFTTGTLSAGDEIVIGVDNLGLAETVEIASVREFPGDDYPMMLVTLNNAHDPGALCAAMPFPAWGSSQRHIFVVLSEAAALDANTRRRVHEHMAKIVTGVTTWSISPASGAATAGPLTLDDDVLGRLSMNPFGTITVP